MVLLYMFDRNVYVSYTVPTLFGLWRFLCTSWKQVENRGQRS